VTYQGHSEITTDRREPYLWPDATMSNVRESIRKRYALLQLWYTMFYEHERYGKPILRPMFMDFRNAPNSVFEIDNQYMLSDKLLVHPITDPGITSVDVYFPTIFYDFDDFRKIEPGTHSIAVDSSKIPVFQTGGSIIPMKETIRKSSEYMANDPISLFIAVSTYQEAAGTLYIDDGKSYDYRKEKKYLYLRIELLQNRLTSRQIDEDAHFETDVKIGRIQIAGLANITKAELETASGARTKLEILNVNSNFFEIKTNDLSVTNEWTIILNSAKQNALCASLVLATLAIHVLKLF